MTPQLKTLIACAAIAGLGISGLWMATNRGSALTAEGARRLRALQAPGPVPNSTLTDRHGETVRLWRDGTSVILVEFIYTTCPTICQSAGAAFAQLHARLHAEGLAADVGLLSVTFDLLHDGPVALAAYETSHHADGRQWRIVKPESQDLKPLLEAFGVVVLPDPIGGFQHNAAIHMVSETGQLIGIFDLGDLDGVVDRLATIRKGKT